MFNQREMLLKKIIKNLHHKDNTREQKRYLTILFKSGFERTSEAIKKTKQIILM